MIMKIKYEIGMWIFIMKTQFNRYFGWYRFRSASLNKRNC